MAGPDTVIVAENLWKSFPVQRDRPGLKELLVNAPRFFNGRTKGFWALRDVSFTVNKGESLGIIGRNGAGKSTLLSLLLGVALPTKGRLEVRGNRTPLLELGAGFHHGMEAIKKLCHRAIWLEQGEVRAEGEAGQVVEEYLNAQGQA